jgi:hypothetical protein
MVPFCAAHEVLLYLAMRSSKNGQPGVPFVGLARRLGEAVEEEVIIHRVLHDSGNDKSNGTWRSRPMARPCQLA